MSENVTTFLQIQIAKEYATIDAILAYLNLTPFRIKVDRIFNGLNFTLYGENTCV